MLSYKDFSKSHVDGEKKETVDINMKDDEFLDVTHKLKGSKRNRTPTDLSK